MRPKVIDLDGVTQYTYPHSDRRDAVGCTFHAAEAVLKLTDAAEFPRLVERCAANDQGFFVALQMAVIDAGLAARGEALAAGMANNAIFPEELGRYTARYRALGIDNAANQSHVVTGFLDTDLDRLFAPCSAGRRFVLMQADGQTFAAVAVDAQHAFLFDSHRSQFRVVDRAALQRFLETEIYHDNPMQTVDFYHGAR